METALEEWMALGGPATRTVRLEEGGGRVMACAYVGEACYLTGKAKKDIMGALVSLDKRLCSEAGTVLGSERGDDEEDDDDEDDEGFDDDDDD